MSTSDRPEIVVICGSMRFFLQMLEVASELTMNGCIVLAPFSIVAPEDQNSPCKVVLDQLHLQKIDMADWVIVVTDQNEYIGESTRREISYAHQVGKPVRFRRFMVESEPSKEHKHR